MAGNPGTRSGALGWETGTMPFHPWGEGLLCPRSYPGNIIEGTWIAITKDVLIIVLSPFRHTHSPVPQMSLVSVLGWLFWLILPSFLRRVCQVLLMMGKPRSLRPSPATREPRLSLHPPWNGGPFSPSLCRERDWPGLFFWGSLLVEEGGHLPLLICLMCSGEPGKEEKILSVDSTFCCKIKQLFFCFPKCCMLRGFQRHRSSGWKTLQGGVGQGILSSHRAGLSHYCLHCLPVKQSQLSG